MFSGFRNNTPPVASRRLLSYVLANCRSVHCDLKASPDRSGKLRRPTFPVSRFLSHIATAFLESALFLGTGRYSDHASRIWLRYWLSPSSFSSFSAQLMLD